MPQVISGSLCSRQIVDGNVGRSEPQRQAFLVAFGIEKKLTEKVVILNCRMKSQLFFPSPNKIQASAPRIKAADIG